MKNELTERWEKTGLLQELDDFNKNECADSLQKATDLLLGEMSDYVKKVDEEIGGSDRFFAEAILPIIRRLYTDAPTKMPGISMKWLFTDFGEYARKNCASYKELGIDLNGCDWEADLIIDYMRGIVERL